MLCEVCFVQGEKICQFSTFCGDGSDMMCQDFCVPDSFRGKFTMKVRNVDKAEVYTQKKYTSTRTRVD